MIQDKLINDEDEDFVTPAENFVRKNLTKYIGQRCSKSQRGHRY